MSTTITEPTIIDAEEIVDDKDGNTVTIQRKHARLRKYAKTGLISAAVVAVSVLAARELEKRTDKKIEFIDPDTITIPE